MLEPLLGGMFLWWKVQFIKGHVAKKDVPDDFAKAVCECVAPGVEYLLNNDINNNEGNAKKRRRMSG